VHKPCFTQLFRKYCLSSIKWNDIEVDMPKVKHNSEESSTSPNIEISFDSEQCVKCNELVTAEFLECI